MSQKSSVKPFLTQYRSDKLKCKNSSESSESSGLRVFCGITASKTVFYRYSSPVISKLVQLKVGNFPQIALIETSVKLQEFKQLRQLGRCPVTELKEEKQYKKTKTTPAAKNTVNSKRTC